MPSKVCIACGLTTDSSGNLIVDTSGTWPLTATCADTNGTPIYCTTDGSLRGPAEKFSQFNRIGKNYVTDSPVRMTTLVAQDGKLYALTSTGVPGITPRNSGNAGDNTPLKFTIPNPSKCLPFHVYLESGISHAYINYTGSPGSFSVELSSYVVITGATEAFSGGTGHQIWGFDTGTENVARSIQFDTMGARATVDPPSGATKFTILPGGAMIVTAYPTMSLTLSGSSDVADIQNYTIDVNWWGSND